MRYYFTAGGDGVYEETGRRLPRLEAINHLRALKIETPVYVYLMGDYEQTKLKVGIAENVEKRRKENERDSGIKLEAFKSVLTSDRELAGQIERSALKFLWRMGRGPVFRREYFNLHRNDTDLIQRILDETPLRIIPAVFDSLTNHYVPMVQQWHNDHMSDYARQEIELQFGEKVVLHLDRELKKRNPPQTVPL